MSAFHHVVSPTGMAWGQLVFGVTFFALRLGLKGLSVFAGGWGGKTHIFAPIGLAQVILAVSVFLRGHIPDAIRISGESVAFVDVEFSDMSPFDVIVKISRPYIEYQTVID